MEYIKGCDAGHPFRLERVILMQDKAGLTIVTGEIGEPKCVTHDLHYHMKQNFLGFSLFCLS